MEFKGTKVLRVWRNSIRRLVESPLIVPTERNGDTLELNNVVLIIKEPLSSLDEVRRFDKDRGIDYDRDERVKYWESIDCRLKEFDSRGHSKINQLLDVSTKLTGNPYNRQAYTTIWSPDIDVFSNYPLCIVGAHFNIRNDKLNMTSVIRSNDAWGQALDDIYHLIKIQEEVAEELSVPVGTYTHFAMSYHIYMTDLIKAKLFLGS